MGPDYRTHLCTFMGRQENLEILLLYIDRALELGAVDNYWMIDMTRCIDDHEYIYEYQQKLNAKYPGRVHIYNRETRGKELKDLDAIKKGVGSWKTFYKFLDRFNDNDIIAKCDDDTLYIDIETLKAAFKFRWNNKQPYLMHANCINNGLTAYHQHKQGIWTTAETDIYPSAGLTGPLFSFPEIACEHHKQFTSDLIKSNSNIDKYKLSKNILFQQRISINFIFMLGSDRDTLSKIDVQDEYETSSKIPQCINRPNCIIGGFTAAHHTYGVQEPVMEEHRTLDCYKQLSSILSKKSDYINKPITDTLNSTTTLQVSPNVFIAKHPANNNSKILQDVDTGFYLSIKGKKQEKVMFGPDRERIPTGIYMLQNELYVSESSTDAALMDLDLTSPTTLKFTNSNKLIKTGGSRKEITENYSPDKNFFPGHMIAEFFHGGYKSELANFIKQPSGNYRIQSNTHKNYYLKSIINKKTNKVNTRWEKNVEYEFIVHDKSVVSNSINVINVHRCTDNIMNDGTYYTIGSTGEVIYKAREYYWMVDYYLWEIVNLDSGEVNIKLIYDEHDGLYLSVSGDDIVTSPVPYNWVIHAATIKDPKTGKYIQGKHAGVCLSETGTKLL